MACFAIREPVKPNLKELKNSGLSGSALKLWDSGVGCGGSLILSGMDRAERITAAKLGELCNCVSEAVAEQVTGREAVEILASGGAKGMDGENALAFAKRIEPGKRQEAVKEIANAGHLNGEALAVLRQELLA